MRPERLELEGFTAFREPTTVDFTDADLFAFWGPTGAGKSSLIDAIIFALYGSVPRYNNKNLVAPVISQQASEARVHLTFAVGPERYVVARVVRATASGGATTKEARFERHGADGAVEVLAGDADGVTAGVEQLLGLSYEHFTTCVVLPQGAVRPLPARQALANARSCSSACWAWASTGAWPAWPVSARPPSRGRREAIEASLADIALAAGLDEGRRRRPGHPGGRSRRAAGRHRRHPRRARPAGGHRSGRPGAPEGGHGCGHRPGSGAGPRRARRAGRPGGRGPSRPDRGRRRLGRRRGGAEAAEADAAAFPEPEAIDADLARWRRRDELVARLATGSAKVAEQAEAMVDALLEGPGRAPRRWPRRPRTTWNTPAPLTWPRP